MTKQQVFDKVVLGFVEQKAFARVGGPGGSCRYRTDEGFKCAIGMLIPDDIYDPQIEFENPSSMLQYINTDVTFRPIIDKDKFKIAAQYVVNLIDEEGSDDIDNAHFLSLLQSVHDEAESGDDFFRELKFFAVQHELDYTILFENEHGFDNWPSEQGGDKE